MTTSPNPGEQGSPEGRAGTDGDVRLAFERLPTPTATTSGPDHVVVACNAAYRALTGREDIIGRPVRHVFPELTGQRVFELLDEAYRTGRPVEQREWRFQYDRGEGVADVFQDFLVAPTTDPEGDAGGLLITTVDVTARVLERRRAEAVALATQREFTRALDVVAALQRALLPLELPLLPGADVAARYLLATEDRTAGGDWFDAVVRPDGRLALVVGDVVGHGIDASAVMGQLRAVLHDRLLGEGTLGEVLAALDRFARRQPDAAAATVCLVELDPNTGRLSYCTAGHPPPLVVGAGGESRFLTPTGGSPLATGGIFTQGEDRLEPEDLVLLYTDGVIERPGRTPAESTVELGQVAADAVTRRALRVGAPERAAERACQIGLELLTRATGHADDITLLAAQRVSPPDPVSMRLEATPDSPAAVRDRLSRWLHVLDVRPLDELAIQHAVSELVSNCAEHAYRQPAQAGPVEVTAELDRHGTMVCVVRDHGRWREPDHTDPWGRGLAITAELVDDLAVDAGDDGTAVTIRHALGRDAALFSDHPGLVVPLPPGPPTAHEVQVDGEVVVVRGPVDGVDAPALQRTLLAVSHGGSGRVTVDLAGVTHLGSAAVRIFHRLRQDGTELRLVAPPGSAAQHVLDLVRLDHDAPDPGRAAG